MEDIQDKIYQAKTVEELLAIATETGETLTLEDATKLLQEVEDERIRVEGRAKDAFASAEDLSDEELAKIAGGGGSSAMDVINKYKYPARELTYRDGANVKISFSSRDYHCTEYQCRACSSKGIKVVDDYVYCTGCGKYARCKGCKWRVEAGGGGDMQRDHCINPAVRAMHGL